MIFCYTGIKNDGNWFGFDFFFFVKNAPVFLIKRLLAWPKHCNWQQHHSCACESHSNAEGMSVLLTGCNTYIYGCGDYETENLKNILTTIQVFSIKNTSIYHSSDIQSVLNRSIILHSSYWAILQYPICQSTVTVSKWWLFNGKFCTC